MNVFCQVFTIASLITFLLTSNLFAQQIYSEPERPDQQEEATIFFDATKCDCPLSDYNGDLWAHTGVIFEGSSTWRNVIGSWGQNDIQPQLQNLGNGLYSLAITSSIEDFYNVNNQDIRQMAFVFRNAQGDEQTADLFIDVFQNTGVSIVEPIANQIVNPQEPMAVEAVFLGADSMRYEWNGGGGTSLGDVLTAEIVPEQPGDLNIRVLGYKNGQVSEEEIRVLVRAQSNYAPLPPGDYNLGVNRSTVQDEVLFVVEAPGKEHVFITGDFNNWQPQLEHQMHVDTSNGFFWLRLNDLDPDVEYAYQYIIDGRLFLADPYTEKVLDPFNDGFIEEETYPDLKPYPFDKAQGIVSTFQINEEPYQWQNNDYQRPAKEELIIYELLLREFTFSHSYQSVIDTLDYLEDLGINAIELMPINEFEGNSSWGYNTSFHFALDKYYGTKNDFKRFVDACHERGIAVLLDIVLNHTYSQNPMVQMYWDEQRSRPAADNPWFNETSPNQVFSFGYDMDHESPRTRRYSKQVLEHWIEEYRIDGYRLDFTKGLTNVPGDGGGYDPSRIRILKDYADHIWTVDPKSIVILEHFAPRREEQELADYGMMLWGNLNYSFSQIAMGFLSGSSITGADYRNRGFSDPLLIPYMESHDEERQMYKTLTYGNTQGDYDTRDFATAIERSKMAATLYFSVPGPKLIWMFGELGFDISIDDPCRICEKPVFWPFADEPGRMDLYWHYSELLHLRDSLEILNSRDFDIGGSGTVKWVMLRSGQQRMLTVINMDVNERSLDMDLEVTGEWYEFYSQTSFVVENPTENLDLEPGAYRIYSNFQIAENASPDVPLNSIVYPNPNDGELFYKLSFQPDRARLIDTKGAIVAEWSNLQSAEGRLELAIPVYGSYHLHFTGSDEEYVETVVLYR